MSKPKKIALGVLGVFGLIVAVVLVLAATKPDQIHVERKLVMQGTPADVFPYANDLRKFTTWIPWTDLDPNMTIEYSDPSAGAGAWYTWAGNDDVGSGRMDMISTEPTKVVHKLQFVEPFASESLATVSMKAIGADQVEVTWAFDQEANFGTKIMCVFMDMDKMMGPDFEKGLSKLEVLVEADAKARAGS
jgi:hypothetical protein